MDLESADYVVIIRDNDGGVHMDNYGLANQLEQMATEMEHQESHGNGICPKYQQSALPDENDKCSLCGAWMDEKLNTEADYKVIEGQSAPND
jgi:hypothetical protein